MSLALSRDRRITAAIEDAAASGILIVLAAGNDGLAHPGNLEPARALFPRQCSSARCSLPASPGVAPIAPVLLRAATIMSGSLA